MFQHTLYIKFTAPTLQPALTSIQLNDYLTCMLLHLDTSCSLILLSFLVVILTAVGYDYSK